MAFLVEVHTCVLPESDINRFRGDSLAPPFQLDRSGRSCCPGATTEWYVNFPRLDTPNPLLDSWLEQNWFQKKQLTSKTLLVMFGTSIVINSPLVLILFLALHCWWFHGWNSSDPKHLHRSLVAPAGRALRCRVTRSGTRSAGAQGAKSLRSGGHWDNHEKTDCSTLVVQWEEASSSSCTLGSEKRIMLQVLHQIAMNSNLGQFCQQDIGCLFMSLSTGELSPPIPGKSSSHSPTWIFRLPKATIFGFPKKSVFFFLI